MAAGEDQPEPVVWHCVLLGATRLVAGVQNRGLGLPVLAGSLPAETVNCPVTGRRDDPARRAWRHPVLRPPLNSCGERILDRLFGGVDIAEEADQHRHSTAVLLPEDRLDFRPADGGMTGHQARTSPCSGPTSIGRPRTVERFPAEP